MAGVLRSGVCLALGLLLATSTPIHAAGDPTQKLDGVLDLTPETFPTYVNGAKAALVEFYAPWCGHCKHLVPEYKKLGELVQADPALRNRVVIAKVDADAHRSVGSQFGVQGFPTIKFFPRGKPANKQHAKDYSGARTADAFVTFLQQELAADGGYGRVEALDTLVAGWGAATDKAAVLKQVKAKVGKLEGEAAGHGELYVKVLEKAAEKGEGWVAKEKARVTKLLEGGSLATGKADELSRKLAVLTAVLGGEGEGAKAA